MSKSTLKSSKRMKIKQNTAKIKVEFTCGSYINLIYIN